VYLKHNLQTESFYFFLKRGKLLKQNQTSSLSNLKIKIEVLVDRL